MSKKMDSIPKTLTQNRIRCKMHYGNALANLAKEFIAMSRINLATAIAFVIISAITCEFVPGMIFANVLDRDRDPLIITGISLPKPIGTSPANMVAFRYNNGWVQMPVQIDEMNIINFGTIEGTNPASRSLSVRFSTGNGGPLPVRLDDVSGRLVMKLLDGSWRAGDHETAFDVSKHPAGIYFARAEHSGTFTNASRIVILR